MLRSIVKNSSIYFVSGILTRGISFFLLPLYTSVLTREDYGSLEAISIVSTIAIMLFSFQINEGVSRYYNELKDQHTIRVHTSTVVFFILISFTVFYLLCLAGDDMLAVFYGVPVNIANLASLNIFFNALFYFSQNQLQWKIKPFLEAITSLAYNISAIGLSILLTVYYEYGISGIMLAQIIAAAIGIVLAAVFTWKDFGLYFSFSILKKLLKFSFPLVPRALSVFLLLFTDRICVREMLGLDSLGVFSLGTKIASIMIIVNIGLATALSPLIYKHHKEQDTPVKIGVVFRYYVLAGVMILAALSLFAGTIIDVFANENYMAAAICIPLLASSVFFSSLLQFFPGLALSKRTGLMSLITVIASVLNLILNLLLIDRFGIFGCSIATAVCFLLNFLLLYRYSQKEYWVDVSVTGLFIMLALIYFAVTIAHIYQTSIIVNLAFYVTIAVATWFLILRKGDTKLISKFFKRATPA